jgi:hypothetical protein
MLSLCGICYAEVSDEKAAESKNTVLSLYKDFAWEAVLKTADLNLTGLLDQTRPVLSRYFDNQLVNLLLADRVCAEKNGICNLDYLPWWGGQDPDASDLQIQPTENPKVIMVRFKYHGNESLIKLKYVMTKTKAGWRIADIVEESGNSMLKTLQHK